MAQHDRFLRSRPQLQAGAALGRVFSVVQETWATSDDPKKTSPQQLELATRRTASDAADLAREAALAYDQHGFHKPSGAWWGSDGQQFHRFVVAAGRKTHAGRVLVGVGVGALAVAALGTLLRKRS